VLGESFAASPRIRPAAACPPLVRGGSDFAVSAARPPSRPNCSVAPPSLPAGGRGDAVSVRQNANGRCRPVWTCYVPVQAAATYAALNCWRRRHLATPARVIRPGVAGPSMAQRLATSIRRVARLGAASHQRLGHSRPGAGRPAVTAQGPGATFASAEQFALAMNQRPAVRAPWRRNRRCGPLFDVRLFSGSTRFRRRTVGLRFTTHRCRPAGVARRARPPCSTLSVPGRAIHPNIGGPRRCSRPADAPHPRRARAERCYCPLLLAGLAIRVRVARQARAVSCTPRGA